MNHDFDNSSPAAAVSRMRVALEGKALPNTNELALQAVLAALFTAAGFDVVRELRIGTSKLDLCLDGWIAAEVKYQTGKGNKPMRQLCRYLEGNSELRAGVLISTRRISLPLDRYETRDGRSIPLFKIELWTNSLL